MPSLRELISSKANRLDVVPERLVQRAAAVQPQLLDAVLARLGEMDITEGNFEITTRNLELVNEAVEDVRTTLLGSDYVNATGEYAREFDRQKDITDEAVSKGFEGTSTTANTLLASSKKKAVDTLLKVEFVNTGLYDPIRGFLDSAVSTGAPLTQTISDLRNLINGSPENLGLLNRYAKQISFDAFAQADRQYTHALGEELEVEWYFYAGGEIEPVTNSKGTETGGTREFCQVRNEKYWHKGEIQSWVGSKGLPTPSGKWSGQIKGTNEGNIFQFLGGWNCRHTLMPVSESIVPKKRLQEAIARGFYKPDARTRELLGLDSTTPKRVPKLSEPPQSVKGKDLTISSLNDYIDDIDNRNKVRASMPSNHNEFMIQEARQGYKKPVETLSEDQVRSAIKSDKNNIIYRGHGGDSVNRHNDFVKATEKHRPDGIYGNGYYHTISKGGSNVSEQIGRMVEAETYAGSDKLVSIGVIRKDAKMITYKEARELRKKDTTHSNFKLSDEDAAKLDSKTKLDIRQAQKEDYGEMGAYLTKRGYDGMIVEDEGYFVLFNRTAVQYSDKPYLISEIYE